MFIEMLLSSEEDLREEKPQTMAFPIFGRGRALYALVGKGINNDTIDAAGADLTGPCTCTVKEQNPGIDMLMPVAWDELVEKLPEADKPLPPLVGLTGFGEEPEKTEPEPGSGAAEAGTTEDPATGPATETATEPETGSVVAPTADPSATDATNVAAGTTPTASSNSFLVVPVILIAGVVLFGTWCVIGRRG
jgi:hypothetical protein